MHVTSNRIGINLSLSVTIICYTENVNSPSEYLSPTGLCDFTNSPEIHATAEKLTSGMKDVREKAIAVFDFVRGLPYGLEDWDVKASETLRKGWGMCSGKTNLLVTMLRSLGIAARYRILRIKSERQLWDWVASQSDDLAKLMGEPAPEQDHVIAEVYLDGWQSFDPARDLPFEAGLKKLGIPLERKLVMDEKGEPRILTLASLDAWALQRQQSRRFRANRQQLFDGMNRPFDKVREFGGRKGT